MPAQQEIVHWYNTVPDVYNGDIPDDYPDTPDNYPTTEIIELRNLLNRLCNEISTLSYEMANNIVKIREHDTVYLFNIREWLINRQVVIMYLQDWFPLFRIYHGTELWHEIMDFISDIDSKVSYLYTENEGNIFRFRRNSDHNIIFAFTYNDYVNNKIYVYDHLRQLFPYAGIPYIMGGIADSTNSPNPVIESANNRTIHPGLIPMLPYQRTPFNDRIRETLNLVAIGLGIQLHYAITPTHVRIEDRSFEPIYTLSYRIDFFEMNALPIAEISRRIRLDREVRINGIPNMVTRPIDSITTPSPCTGKEEASDINYLDVI